MEIYHTLNHCYAKSKRNLRFFLFLKIKNPHFSTFNNLSRKSETAVPAQLSHTRYTLTSKEVFTPVLHSKRRISFQGNFT